MEYIIEQFNIDMRKANLYMSSAITKYEIECAESMLYESTDDFAEDIFTEATEGLLQRIRQFFANLLQKIKEFFQKLVEKMREFFQRKQVDKLEKTVKANPRVANTKIKVIDIKYIEETYGKRRFLCKALEKKLKNGTLTQDDIDDAVEKYDKLGKTAKVVGITVGAALAIVTGGVILKKMNNLKNNVTDDNKNLENVTEEVITKEEKTQPKEDPATSNAGKGSDKFASFSKPEQKPKSKENTDVDPAFNDNITEDDYIAYGKKIEEYSTKNQSKMSAGIYKKSKDTNRQIGKARAKIYHQVQDAAKNNASIAKSAQELATLNAKSYNDAMNEFAKLYKTAINLANEQINYIRTSTEELSRHMDHSHKYHDIHKDTASAIRDVTDEASKLGKQGAYNSLLNQKRRDSEKISGMLGISDPMAKK